MFAHIDFPQKNVPTPGKRGIWRQHVRNRLAEKKDVPKVDGSCYNQQNAVLAMIFATQGNKGHHVQGTPLKSGFSHNPQEPDLKKK